MSFSYRAVPDTQEVARMLREASKDMYRTKVVSDVLFPDTRKATSETITIPHKFPKMILIEHKSVKQDYVYKFHAPLLDRKSLQVSFHGSQMNIEYQLRDLFTDELTDTGKGNFAAKLPSDIRFGNLGEAKLTYVDGVLTVALPQEVTIVKLGLE